MGFITPRSGVRSSPPPPVSTGTSNSFGGALFLLVRLWCGNFERVAIYDTGGRRTVYGDREVRHGRCYRLGGWWTKRRRATRLTFAPLETVKRVEVQVTADDLLDEPSETFRIVLSKGVNGRISNSKGRATITNNTTPEPTPVRTPAPEGTSTQHLPPTAVQRISPRNTPPLIPQLL